MELLLQRPLEMGQQFDISSNQIFAPCDAKVETIFPTGHAIGLSTSNGINILIHAGIDTVNLEGKGFKSFVSEGDAIKKGDLLMEMDPQVIKDAGYSTQTMVVLMDVEGTISVDQGQKEVGDHIIRIS